MNKIHPLLDEVLNIIRETHSSRPENEIAARLRRGETAVMADAADEIERLQEVIRNLIKGI